MGRIPSAAASSHGCTWQTGKKEEWLWGKRRLIADAVDLLHPPLTVADVPTGKARGRQQIVK